MVEKEHVIEVLKKVDYVLCEDTRVTGKLLKAYEIDKRMEDFNPKPIKYKGVLYKYAKLASPADKGATTDE